jgi:hypothetical protein
MNFVSASSLVAAFLVASSQAFMCQQMVKFTNAPPKAENWPTVDYCNWNNCDGTIQGGDYCNEFEWHCTAGCADGAKWCSGDPEVSVCDNKDLLLIEQLNLLYNKNRPLLQREAPSLCPEMLSTSVYPGSRVDSCITTRGKLRVVQDKSVPASVRNVTSQMSSSCVIMREDHQCAPSCDQKGKACEKMVSHRNTKRKFHAGTLPTCTCGGEYGTNGAGAGAGPMWHTTTFIVLVAAALIGGGSGIST